MVHTATHPYRTAPCAAATGSLRGIMGEKAFKFMLSLSAGISIAGCNPQPEPHPTDPDVTASETDKRISAERAHMEASFEGLDIIDFEFMDATGVSPQAYDKHTRGNGLRPYYRLENRQGIYETILAGYDQMGEFNPETPQKAVLERYMPQDHDYPEGVTTNNQRVAHTLSQAIADDIVGGSLGAARVVRIDRPGEKTPGRACAVIVMSENFDSDMFVERFSRIDSLLSRQVHDVANFNQAIANHEFAHCVFSVNGQDTWRNESRADLYAIARHIQLNGDDGFAQTWRDLRNLNVIGARDTGHDSIPALDRAIPVLLAAHAQGQLEGLDAQELYNFTIRNMAQTQQQTEAEMWNSLEYQVRDREEAFNDMAGTVSTVGPRMVLDREAAAEKGLSSLETRAVQRVIGSFNTSVEQQFILQCLVARRDASGQENEVFARYRENLTQYVSTQSSAQQAYENLGHRLWQLDNEKTQHTNSHGQNVATFIEQTNRDETGLTNAEKRAILTEMRQNLAQQPGVTPEPAPTQEVELNV